MDSLTNQINELLSQSGLLALPLVFLAGVLTSFTPCVYPMIPVVVGVIGAKGANSRRHAFLMSVAYVTGMAVVYGALGVFSALTGKLFGQWSTHPGLNLAVGVLFIFFALWMFGVFELRLPSFLLQGTKAGKGEGGVGAAFSIGLGSGFVAAPCTAPVLGVLLLHIGTTKNALLGLLLMFTFAFGMGTLLILMGTFTGILATLPKSGQWMESIKKLLALLILAIGLFFVFKAGQFSAF